MYDEKKLNQYYGALAELSTMGMIMDRMIKDHSAIFLSIEHAIGLHLDLHKEKYSSASRRLSLSIDYALDYCQTIKETGLASSLRKVKQVKPIIEASALLTKRDLEKMDLKKIKTKSIDDCILAVEELC